MEQFSLEKWLQDKSRKVCTRDGNIAEIIYTNGKGRFPVIVIDPYEEETEPWQVTENGKLFCNGDDDKLDLFFADEEEELTELQKTLEEDCDCYVNLYNNGKTREELREWIKCWCHHIIDLARKELSLVDNTCGEYTLNEAYKQGKQDALKNLPEWKKDSNNLSSLIYTLDNRGDGRIFLCRKGYAININELLNLPKEE